MNDDTMNRSDWIRLSRECSVSNWDGYGAQPASFRALRRAEDLIASASSKRDAKNFCVI